MVFAVSVATGDHNVAHIDVKLTRHSNCLTHFFCRVVSHLHYV